MHRLTFTALAAVLVTLSLTPEARAAEVEGEVAAVGRYGSAFDLHDYDQPYHAGVGVRGGVSVHDVYLGARIHYWFGTDATNAGQLGGELGYGFHVGDSFVLRPKVGLGVVGFFGSRVAILSVSTPPPNPPLNLGDQLYVEPGVGITYQF